MTDARKLDLTDDELRELADLLDTDASMNLMQAREDELMERLHDQYGEKVFMHILRQLIDLRQASAEKDARIAEPGGSE